MTEYQKTYSWAQDTLADLDLFAMLADRLPLSPDPPVVGEVEVPVDMWYDGSEYILCRTEVMADALADWLNEFDYDAATGYYDPEEDERDDCVDDHTGWYYVHIV